MTAVARTVIEPTAVESPDDLVEIELVPVEVDARCDDLGCEHCDTQVALGFTDAVQAWSDCNRAEGRIYRVGDTRAPGEPIPSPYRLPGDTVGVFIRRRDLPWLQKRHGDRFATAPEATA